MKPIYTVPECYGIEYDKLENCRHCECRKWCRTAADPEPLYKKVLPLAPWYNMETAVPAEDPDEPVPEYSRQDMLEVIVLMMSLDLQTLDMLEQKINNPSVTFAEMGKRKKVSRQAVHNFISKKCLEVPELKAVFKNRKKNAGINRQAA
jgi:hypothetical protein